MRSYSTSWSSNPRDWRLEEALWAHYMHDPERCFKILTRVCNAEVVEEPDYEQTQQAAH